MQNERPQNDLQKRAAELLFGFDFAEIHEYMKSVNWRWAAMQDVPTVEDLRDTAREVLARVINSRRDNSNAGSGGFWAYKFTWADGSQQLALSFAPWHTIASVKARKVVCHD